VGESGTGTFTQTGGSNFIQLGTSSLIVGDQAGAIGTYSLSGSGMMTNANVEIIGASGTGTFVQSGGTNELNGNTNATASLVIGQATGSSGSYYLSGGSLLLDNGAPETIGAAGKATFVQTGGLHEVGDANDFVGLSIGNATYSLSGAGSTLFVYGSEILSTSASFTQSAGTTNTLFEGGIVNNGSYTLTGGALITLGESISGSFNQTGGENSMPNATFASLILSGHAATYSLSGSGTLSVGAGFYIGGYTGPASPGSLIITGGQMTVGGTLQLWNSAGSTINISGGNVSAASTINAATITQTGGTSNLGALSGAGNVLLGSSSGVLAGMTVSSLSQHSLTILSTGTFTLQGGGSSNTVNQLSISGQGEFDLTNGHFFINYGTGADPAASVRQYLTSGYNAGTWNGPGGIISSTAASAPGYGIGYADSADSGNPAGLSSGQIEVAFTLLGDADLNRTVNGIDFGILAANFNKTVSRWDQGDFDYNNIVNGLDFTALAANFNKAASGAAVGGSALSDPALVAFAEANGLMADVPEPTGLSLLVIGGSFVMRRRRANYQ
jgi:hypothetical protein